MQSLPPLPGAGVAGRQADCEAGQWVSAVPAAGHAAGATTVTLAYILMAFVPDWCGLVPATLSTLAAAPDMPTAQLPLAERCTQVQGPHWLLC